MEDLTCPSCGSLWQSQSAHMLLLRDERCLACDNSLSRETAIAATVLEDASHVVLEAAALDEAALLDRELVALRAEASQVRDRAAGQRQDAQEIRSSLQRRQKLLLRLSERLECRERLSVDRRELAGVRGRLQGIQGLLQES